jgi:GNAT superfamily N-acetyltransferase
MGIVIRKLQENELELANNFFNSMYNGSRSIENFKWEFLEGPNGKAIYVIAIDDGAFEYTKVVGIQCAIPIELVGGNGEVLLSAKSEDTLVDPNYRGRKIFERMYEFLFHECRNAGVKCIWGFTPAKKAFERIGFEVPFKANQALIVFNSYRGYSYLSRLNPQNRLIEKLKIGALVLLSRVVSLKRYSRSKRELPVWKVPLQSKADLIKNLVHSPSMYFLNMTEKYISWRLINNPFENGYENYQFYVTDLLIADVIVNFRQPDLGYLEQLLFTKDASVDLKRIVVIQTVQLMKKKVSLLRAMCFDINDELQQQEKILKDCGFLIIKRGSFFVWKQLSPSNLRSNNLFITRLFTQGNQ